MNISQIKFHPISKVSNSIVFSKGIRYFPLSITNNGTSMKIICKFPGRHGFLSALFSFFSLYCCFPFIAYAQSNSDVDPDLQEVQKMIAPVKFDGEILFMVRGTTSFPAAQRAQSIKRRLRKAGDNPALTVDSIKIIPEGEHLQVYVGREFIMNIYEGDAEVENLNMVTFSELVKRKIGTALTLYRYARSKPILIRKSIQALAAMALLTLILFLFFWLFRKLNAFLKTRIEAKINSVEDKSFKLIQSTQIWKAFHVLFKTLRIIIAIILISVFINYVLSIFPWTNNAATFILKLFLDPVAAIGSGIYHFLPSLAFLIVIFLATRYLLKLIRLLFTGLSQGGIVIKDFDPDWAMPTFKILRILIVAFAVIIAYPYIPGSDSSAFKGVSVFMGLLLSLGSSSFISNVIAGYSLTYRRAFKKGDRIEVNEKVGFVEEQKLLVTRLRSIKNEEIIVPNSMLINSSIINYSIGARGKGIILHTVVGIGYETPWRQVDAMLRLAADRTDGILKNPPPFVLKLSLGDFAVNYEINAFCADVDRMHLIYNALHQNILDIFNENNVQIMTPAYEGDPAEPKVVPEEQWNAPVKSSEKKVMSDEQ